MVCVPPSSSGCWVCWMSRRWMISVCPPRSKTSTSAGCLTYCSTLCLLSGSPCYGSPRRLEDAVGVVGLAEVDAVGVFELPPVGAEGPGPPPGHIAQGVQLTGCPEELPADADKVFAADDGVGPADHIAHHIHAGGALAAARPAGGPLLALLVKAGEVDDLPGVLDGQPQGLLGPADGVLDRLAQVGDAAKNHKVVCVADAGRRQGRPLAPADLCAAQQVA